MTSATISNVKKRSVVVDGGRKTSISLEDEFWRGLLEIAKARDAAVGATVVAIGVGAKGNLSSAIRLAVLAHYKSLAGISA